MSPRNSRPAPRDSRSPSGCPTAPTSRPCRPGTRPRIRAGFLLQRCLLGARREDRPHPTDRLPEAVVTAVVEAMAAADPQADVRTELGCPSCGHRWPCSFDIVSFFWSEIEAWAWRVLQDVHRLARAYGWREQDILELSPWRRRVYLEMTG